MTKLQAEIIVGLADNQLSIARASEKLYMHRNSITYHIRRIYKDTGKNPLDFHDMCWLLPKARAILGKYGTFVNDGRA